MPALRRYDGSAFPDTLVRDDGPNNLNGYYGDDQVKGFGGNDILEGSTGDDVLIGGTGADLMQGNLGTDTFAWTSIADTGVTGATADEILNFHSEQGDRIDLDGVDANLYAAGNQAFTFIGTSAFSGTPGEINYLYQDGYTVIQMQTGTSADVEGIIRLTGYLTPQAGWFVL